MSLNVVFIGMSLNVVFIGMSMSMRPIAASDTFKDRV